MTYFNDKSPSDIFETRQSLFIERGRNLQSFTTLTEKEFE